MGRWQGAVQRPIQQLVQGSRTVRRCSYLKRFGRLTLEWTSGSLRSRLFLYVFRFDFAERFRNFSQGL